MKQILLLIEILTLHNAWKMKSLWMCLALVDESGLHSVLLSSPVNSFNCAVYPPIFADFCTQLYFADFFIIQSQRSMTSHLHTLLLCGVTMVERSAVVNGHQSQCLLNDMHSPLLCARVTNYYVIITHLRSHCW